MIKPYYDHAGITIYHGDCREIVPQLESVDFFYVDPPYNAKKGYGPGKDNLPLKEYLSLMEQVYLEAIKLSPKWITHLPKKYYWEFLNFLPRGQLIPIQRGAQGHLNGRGWSDQYDILYARGRPSHAPHNLWNGIRLKGEGYFFREETFGHHGYTPRPIAHRAIKYMTNIGDTVLDFFMGTGTTIIEALEAGRKPIGIEYEEENCEIAVKRLSQEVFDFTHKEIV